MMRTSKPAPQTKDCAFRITDSIPNLYSERLYELPRSLQDSLEFWQIQWRRGDCKSIQTETFNGNFGFRNSLSSAREWMSRSAEARTKVIVSEGRETSSHRTTSESLSACYF